MISPAATAEGADFVFGFTPADHPDVRSCVAQYYAELARRFEGGFDPLAGGYSESDPGKASEEWCVLVRRDGECVGCGMLKRLDAMTGEIKRVWCHPDSRGKGLARRIMAMLEQKASEHGITTLRLDTHRALGEARALYLKLGYVEIAPYNDNAYADHWFEKSLPGT